MEHNLLLNFLQENTDIEKPTAQIYCTKFLDETKMDANTDMLRLKVRYWKSCFHKAEAWRKSTGAGLDSEEGIYSITQKLNKICPNYDRLAELFHNKDCSNVVVDSTNFNVTSDITALDVGSVLYTEPLSVEIPDDVVEAAGITQQIDETVPTSTPLANRSLGQKFKKRMPKNGLSELAEMQNKSEAFYEKRLCIEKEKLDLEKLKASQDFEIRKLELEQKERLAIMEMKFKYNKE